MLRIRVVFPIPIFQGMILFRGRTNVGITDAAIFFDCMLRFIIMEPFIKSKYAGALDVTIEEICDRMNTVRNGIAHSRLDLNLEAIHLSDLKIIEELLYAMRFQYLHIDSRPIQIGIKKLFGENIAVE